MGSKITMYRENNLTYRTEILAYRDSRLDYMPVRRPEAGCEAVPVKWTESSHLYDIPVQYCTCTVVLYHTYIHTGKNMKISVQYTCTSKLS